jgi:hypothetical protein
MKESGAPTLDRQWIQFVNSCQGEDVKQILPVPVGHASTSFFTLCGTRASTDRLYKKVEVGDSSARVAFG